MCPSAPGCWLLPTGTSRLEGPTGEQAGGRVGGEEGGESLAEVRYRPAILPYRPVGEASASRTLGHRGAANMLVSQCCVRPTPATPPASPFSPIWKVPARFLEPGRGT